MMNVEHKYAPLDFSSIMGDKYAVHCDNPDDAWHFCSEVKRQFGKEFLVEGTTYWDIHKCQTAYAPRIHNDDRGMTCCYVDYFVKKGYTIVPFKNLKTMPELGDIDLGSVDITILLGGGPFGEV